MSLTPKQIENMLDTKKGRTKLANLMVYPLRNAYRLSAPQSTKVKKERKITLVDIQDKILKVGQRVVFCENARETELDIGIIKKISPKSVYIKRDMKDMRSSMDRQMNSKPGDKYYTEKSEYCTKKLITTYSEDNPGYNRIEVYVI